MVKLQSKDELIAGGTPSGILIRMSFLNIKMHNFHTTYSNQDCCKDTFGIQIGRWYVITS